ncbi:hypothetical protein SUDANB21_05892 [Streptomyces sp. enrichment culture]
MAIRKINTIGTGAPALAIRGGSARPAQQDLDAGNVAAQYSG